MLVRPMHSPNRSMCLQGCVVPGLRAAGIARRLRHHPASVPPAYAVPRAAAPQPSGRNQSSDAGEIQNTEGGTGVVERCSGRVHEYRRRSPCEGSGPASGQMGKQTAAACTGTSNLHRCAQTFLGATPTPRPPVTPCKTCSGISLNPPPPPARISTVDSTDLHHRKPPPRQPVVLLPPQHRPLPHQHRPLPPQPRPPPRPQA